jgi:hypothetical protein
MMGWNSFVEKQCCNAKPDTSQLSIPRRFCPTVVDHMHSKMTAWKNSICWGVTSNAEDSSDFVFSKRIGARDSAAGKE